MAVITRVNAVVVGDILEDTIVRSTKTQTTADGELVWLRSRLDAKRRSNFSASVKLGENSAPKGIAFGNGGAPAGKENSGVGTSRNVNKAPMSMSVLQLRRFLRAIGQPTMGLKPELIARLEEAVSSGIVKAYVDGAKNQPRVVVECAGQRRKTEAMLDMAESMLTPDVKAEAEVTPKRPLRLSQSSAHENNTSRSSVGSERNGKAGSKKLSGAEQDAVVAKIRSVAKRSASPEKKLPFQDDDTPTTKSMRLKKEMEDRLARQNQAKNNAKMPKRVPAPPTASDSQEQPPSPLVVPVSPPSLRPPVPTSPAPMPPSSPPRSPPAATTAPATSPIIVKSVSTSAESIAPPPPQVAAPQPAPMPKAAAPPAPEGSAPRPGAIVAPRTPEKGSYDVRPVADSVPEAPSSPAPVPAGIVAKEACSSATKEDHTPVTPKSGFGSPKSGFGSPSKKEFGSPSRHRTPATKTTPRKANPFANNSMSSPSVGSPLKASALKALNRVGVKADAEATSPSTSSTTQDAFAKFRAMDNAKKGTVPGFKRTSPSPTKPQMSPTKQFQSSISESYPSTGGASVTPSKFDTAKARREKQEQREAEAAAAKAKADAAASAASRAKAEKGRADAARARADALLKAKAKSAADKSAADEARREAQAKAEARAREAALKTAMEREAALKAAAEQEAVAAQKASALKKEEAKKKAAAAAKRAADRAAAAAAAAEVEAAAKARKEDEDAAAAALKRAQAASKIAKPPTPPRPLSGKGPPPTPPRPGHHGSQVPPPPTPPRPPSYPSTGTSAWNSPAPSTPLASTSTASSTVKKESHKLALEKKKQEIAKRYRMEDMRNKKLVAKQQAAAAVAPAPAPVALPPAPKPAPAAPPAPAPVPAAKPATPKEDRESYDDYDVEPESGSESGEEGEEAAQEIVEPQEASDKSGIPDWARGKALAKILDKQYGGPNPLNPDKIFPEFFTCNLEHIFNTKKTKWDRSSSGNWHTDRLTIAEKLAYQRAMGFDK